MVISRFIVPKRIDRDTRMFPRPGWRNAYLKGEIDKDIINVLKLLGPLSTMELKRNVGGGKGDKTFDKTWKRLVAKGEIIILQEHRGCKPRIFGLPGDQYWWIP